jgi:hypothetical protein
MARKATDAPMTTDVDEANPADGVLPHGFVTSGVTLQVSGQLIWQLPPPLTKSKALIPMQL